MIVSMKNCKNILRYEVFVWLETIPVTITFNNQGDADLYFVLKKSLGKLKISDLLTMTIIL